MGEVYWSWEADVKDGHLESFKQNVVAQWNEVAAQDEHTLSNQWVIDEAGSAVKVYQRFTSAEHAFAQFAVNTGWKKLDDYLLPSGMYVSGDYGKTLDFLREHGAVFMRNL